MNEAPCEESCSASPDLGHLVKAMSESWLNNSGASSTAGKDNSDPTLLLGLLWSRLHMGREGRQPELLEAIN